MILCLKTDNGKVFFDGFNRFVHRQTTNKALTGPSIDYRQTQKTAVMQEGDEGLEIELFRDGVFIERVYCFGPAYLMNDKGETIDRI
jgi:hypothetical protein